VVVRHALRNALIPTSLVLGLDFGYYLTGDPHRDDLVPGLGRTSSMPSPDATSPRFRLGIVP